MRDEDSLSLESFTRRAFLIGAGKVSLISLLAGRMYYLQVIKSEEYKTLSEKNRIKIFLISPLRGNILDRFGAPLAVNQNYYRVLLNKDEPENLSEVIEKLSSLLKLPDDAKDALFKKIKLDPGKLPILIHDHLSWENVALIEVNSPELPGVFIDVGQIRYYTTSSLCSHVIGHVGQISEAELEGNEGLLYQPDFKVGKNGIEKNQEHYLRGSFGIRKVEVNAYGLSVRELAREESKAGKDIKLTIDVKLQEFVTSKLDPRGSAAVVLDVNTGAVLSMVSTPGFDPNQLTEHISPAYWKELTENPYFPMTNKAVSSQYAPGSIFKLMVAMAALSDGVDPNATVYCPGYYILGNRKFHCWREGGHGTVNMNYAIMQSCNTYFYTMAKRIGVDKFAEMAMKFGLGNKTGIELPHETTGVIPSKRWKRNRYKKEWQAGDTLNSGIGQGFTLSTPLQLAVMAARIASHGKCVVPHLIDCEHKEEPKTPFETMNINFEHLAIVKKGMESVVNNPWGTAFMSRIPNENFAMAGKTGTSQVISKKNPKQDLSKASTPWENRNHALFVGYAPVHNPKYACSVLIEHGASGAAAAAPVARDILEMVQKLYSS
jgi:penicillin-binding protein 2